jgi:hypothetical protein
MSWISQVSVNTGATADSGWCLWLAEEATGAPHLYPSARAAWNAASDKHADRDYPTDAVVALFWDWTSKSDGVNYGHVVINTPGRGLFSSPKQWGKHGNDWYSSIDEVSNWLGARYLGWSSDLAGLQLSVWNSASTPTPVSPPVGSQGEGIRAEGSDWTYWVPGTQDQMTVQAGLALAQQYTGPIDGNLASEGSVRAIQMVTGLKGFFDLNYYDGQMNKNLCHAILLMAKEYGGYTGRMDWQIDGQVWAAFDTAVRATAPAPVVVKLETPATSATTEPKPKPKPKPKNPASVNVEKPKEPIKISHKPEVLKVASLPEESTKASNDALGILITSAKNRKITYAFYGLGALVISNLAVATMATGVQAPVWLIVASAVIGNLAVPFSSLAIANASTTKK